MTLPKKPLPKIELTPMDREANLQSIRDLAYRIANRSQDPMQNNREALQKSQRTLMNLACLDCDVEIHTNDFARITAFALQHKHEQ